MLLEKQAFGVAASSMSNPATDQLEVDFYCDVSSIRGPRIVLMPGYNYT